MKRKGFNKQRRKRRELLNLVRGCKTHLPETQGGHKQSDDQIQNDKLSELNQTTASPQPTLATNR